MDFPKDRMQFHKLLINILLSNSNIIWKQLISFNMCTCFVFFVFILEGIQKLKQNARRRKGRGFVNGESFCTSSWNKWNSSLIKFIVLQWNCQSVSLGYLVCGLLILCMCLFFFSCFVRHCGNPNRRYRI